MSRESPFGAGEAQEGHGHADRRLRMFPGLNVKDFAGGETEGQMRPEPEDFLSRHGTPADRLTRRMPPRQQTNGLKELESKPTGEQFFP
jgi:hypothetical protein